MIRATDQTSGRCVPVPQVITIARAPGNRALLITSGEVAARSMVDQLIERFIKTHSGSELSAESQRIDRQQSYSRFFSDDFAVLPNIDRGAVHAGGLAGDLGGAAQSAAEGGGEFLLVCRLRATASGLYF